MSHERDVERALERWMDEHNPAQAPDELLERVVWISSTRRPRPAPIARLTGRHLQTRTPTRGTSRRGRNQRMNGYLRPLVAVAAVAIAALVGLNVFPRILGPAAVAPTGPDPTAMQSMAASPNASTPSPRPAGIGPELVPGRYYSAAFELPFSFSVGEGWQVVVNDARQYMLQHTPATQPSGETGVYCASTDEDDWGASCTYTLSQISIQLDAVLASNENDCEGLSVPGIAPGASALLAALQKDQRFLVGEPRSMTVDGLPAQALDVELAADWTGTCQWSNGKPAANLLTVPDPPGPFFGLGLEERSELIVFDVAGRTIAVIFRQGWRGPAEQIVRTFEFGG